MNKSNLGAPAGAAAGAYQPVEPTAIVGQYLTPEDALFAAVEATMNDKENPADKETAELLELLTQCRVAADEEVTATEYLFEWGGVGFAPRENIVSLKAPAKSGKTFALTSLIIAFLLGNYQGLKSSAKEDERVLYVDTEQARNSTRKIWRRILAKAPSAANRVDILNLRQCDSQKRVSLTLLAVERYKPSLIIVDGIADFIAGMDYNDQQQADRIIALLAGVCENLNAVLITAIHTNKGDSNATGWLGKILQQKAALEISITREKTSPVRKLDFLSRDREVPQLGVTIDNTEDGIGELNILSVERLEKDKKESTQAKQRERLTKAGIMPPMKKTKAEISNMLVEAEAITTNAAYTYIRRCLESGLFTEANGYIIYE